MGRLTKRVDGIAVLESWAIDKDKVSIIQRLCNRLAAYEDLMERWKLRSIEEADRIFQRVNALGGTDLMAQYRAIGSIDHLRYLLQAEQDGRLVVLPQKTVWELTMDAGPDCDMKCPVDAWDESLGCDLCSKAKQFAYERPCTQERLKELGKTVFLTREEAEAALAQEGESDG